MGVLLASAEPVLQITPRRKTDLDCGRRLRGLFFAQSERTAVCDRSESPTWSHVCCSRERSFICVSMKRELYGPSQRTLPCQRKSRALQNNGEAPALA